MMQQVLAWIMTILICVALVAIIVMQVTKCYFAWKTKGESLKPRGIEDKLDEGGKEE